MLRPLLTVFASIVTFSATVAVANGVELGKPGTQTYYGTNAAAWISRSCKVVVMSTEKTPLSYVSIADSAKDFIFWSYSPTLAVQKDSSDRISLSDNMHAVPESEDVFSNVAKGSGGIAQALLHLGPTGELKRVEYKYFADGSTHSINCGRLVKR